MYSYTSVGYDKLLFPEGWGGFSEVPSDFQFFRRYVKLIRLEKCLNFHTSSIEYNDVFLSEIVYFQIAMLKQYAVEPGYIDIVLYYTSPIVSDILWYQSVPHG
jgi:hypothetical protein